MECLHSECMPAESTRKNPRFFEVITEKQKTRKVEFLERMVKNRESREGVLGKKAP